TYHVVATSQADSTMIAVAAITVMAPAPVFTSTPSASAAEGTLYTYNMIASDPAGGTISYSFISGPVGAAINGSTLTWTPTSAQSRTGNSFTIAADTSEGGSATQTFSITPLGTIHIAAINNYNAEPGTTTAPQDLST